MNHQILALILFFACPALLHAEDAKPKYGMNAVPLSRDNGYFRRAAATDFWALIPYYLPQQDGRSCSVASVAMIINALRSQLPLTSEDKLVTQPSLLKKVSSDAWSKGVVAADGKGVTLSQLGELTLAAAKAYGFDQAQAQVTHVEKGLKNGLNEFTQLLVENEKSKENFILINFDQGVLTGDTSAGHIAPIAAYDAQSQRVLIVDPDREWFEPYWAPLAKVWESMMTRDAVSGKNRGYVWLKIKP